MSLITSAQCSFFPIFTYPRAERNSPSLLPKSTNSLPNAQQRYKFTKKKRPINSQIYRHWKGNTGAAAAYVQSAKKFSGNEPSDSTKTSTDNAAFYRANRTAQTGVNQQQRLAVCYMLWNRCAHWLCFILCHGTMCYNAMLYRHACVAGVWD